MAHLLLERSTCYVFSVAKVSPVCCSITSVITTTVIKYPLIQPRLSSSVNSLNPCMLLRHEPTFTFRERLALCNTRWYVPALHFLLFLSVHVFCHYRQSLHSATCPWRKSLQGQRRLYLGECPAQLKSSGSLWRPHSCRTTEKAGKMWLISESTTSHCTSNLRSEKSSRNLKKEITEIYQEEKTNNKIHGFISDM